MSPEEDGLLETGDELASVAAIVVTHRRPGLATQVVRGLLDLEKLDPNQVFVVVNGEGGLEDSRIATAVRMIHLAENLGPAAGFRAGMQAAAAAGSYEWYYLCEDDVGLFDLPAPRLRLLLDELQAWPCPHPVGGVVAYGRDLHPRTGHTTVHLVTSTEGFDEVDAASWGASLIHRKVLGAGVLPRDDYFFGYEDFDFFYRLQRAGFLLLLDRRAAASVAGQMSLAGRDESFRGKRPLDAQEPWRAFYVARNFFLLARSHGSVKWIVAHLLYSVRRLQLAGSGFERRAILQGLLAGVLGRRGKDPRFVREQGELPPERRVGPTSVYTSQGRDRRRLVLHVLPYDMARGGQVAARDLRDLLNRYGDRHEILTIFESEAVLLFAEHRLRTKMGWRRNLGFDAVAYLRLRAAIKRLRPDVIVAHGGEPLKYLACTKTGRVPLIYLALGMVTQPVHSGLRHQFYRALMHRADVVAGISNETRDEARELFGIPSNRLLLLPNSRDPDVYRPIEGEYAASSPVRLVFVGHLTPTKRPHLFVEVVGELTRRGRRVVGEIVGDGPLEEEVRLLASDVPVSMLGRRTDVPRLLQRADVLVFTSLPESEGMPGVLIEAGMAGLPVVATACPGVSTVLAGGETGYVVAVDDFDGLVSAVQELVDDPELRRQMGSAARKRCTEEFSLEASGARWQAALDRVATLGERTGIGVADRVHAV